VASYAARSWLELSPGTWAALCTALLAIAVTAVARAVQTGLLLLRSNLAWHGIVSQQYTVTYCAGAWPSSSDRHWDVLVRCSHHVNV
jgi:hypothetical protein